MRIGCLVVPSFPAWAFRRGGVGARPLVVVASGRVVATCRRAARAGVLPEMTAERAQSLLPEAVVRMRDRALEQAAWELALAELHGLTPFLESPAPGVAFLGPVEEEALRAAAARLGVRAGQAGARSLAHLAALRAAPGTALVLPGGGADTFLERFPVEGLAPLGFDARTLERLRLFGYATLRRVAGLSRRHLTAQFGAEGTRLYHLLHPDEEPPVPLFRPAPSVAAGHDLEHPATDPGMLLPVVDHLARVAAARLREHRCRRVSVHLVVRGPGGPRVGARLLPEAVGDPRRLAQTARTLLVDHFHPGDEVDALVLELGTLQTVRPAQASLFDTRPPLYEAVRRVQFRYPGALLRAVCAPHALFEEERTAFEPFPAEPPRRPHTRRRRS